jgi:hypothetical protein
MVDRICLFRFNPRLSTSLTFDQLFVILRYCSENINTGRLYIQDDVRSFEDPFMQLVWLKILRWSREKSSSNNAVHSMLSRRYRCFAWASSE